MRHLGNLVQVAKGFSRGHTNCEAEPREFVAAGATGPTTPATGVGCALLALAMVALGVRGFVFGDFAGTWQRIPVAHLAAHGFFVYLAALIELTTGIGLVVQRVAKLSAATMAIFTLLWTLLLKFPAIMHMPLIEGVWSGAGEIAVILAGAWIVFATWANPDGRFLSGSSGIHNARRLFAAALLPIGLAHLIYLKATAGFVPPWLPWHYFWACLTGVCTLAAALAILFEVWPRLASTLQTIMMWTFTLWVWLPHLVAHVHESGAWSAFLMSAAIAAGASAVADSYRGTRWFAVGVHIGSLEPCAEAATRCQVRLLRHDSPESS
jgi:uncharacterized membrane protein